MTTRETITIDQIRQLQSEAIAAGDTAQAELCALALGAIGLPPSHGAAGYGPLGRHKGRQESALDACIDAINEATAQAS